jgi:hypothetical protein
MNLLLLLDVWDLARDGRTERGEPLRPPLRVLRRSSRRFSRVLTRRERREQLRFARLGLRMVGGVLLLAT